MFCSRDIGNSNQQKHKGKIGLRVLSGFEYRFFAHYIYALLISLKFEYQYIDILVKGLIFSLMCFLRQKCFNLENIQGVPKKKIHRKKNIKLYRIQGPKYYFKIFQYFKLTVFNRDQARK